MRYAGQPDDFFMTAPRMVALSGNTLLPATVRGDHEQSTRAAIEGVLRSSYGYLQRDHRLVGHRRAPDPETAAVWFVILP
jgi:hypothetical protein